MLGLKTPPPLSLYIHIPWCVKKCPYCDFNSHEARTELPEPEYINALLLDLEQELPAVWGRRISSIFIGGGTPSLFAPESIFKLLSEIRSRLNLLPDCEITLEANPGSLELARFKDFRQAGINRLSIGIQSFHDDSLRALGRIHDSKQAIRAAEIASTAGFNSFNLDLMFGLPNQTIEQADSDIKQAIALAPQHISLYQLTIEKNTYFYTKPPALPAHDDLANMQEVLQQHLSRAAYRQYEVSAYASAGYTCKHNLNYWQFGDYLGIGAGAHGKISDHESITRSWKIKHPQTYMDNVSTDQRIGGSTKLKRQDLASEFMMNALRLSDGFDPKLFTERTGITIVDIRDQLKQAELKKLITWSTEKIKPTELGRKFLDDLLLIFMKA